MALPADYLAQNAGAINSCPNCHKPFVVPPVASAVAPIAPPVIGYAGPQTYLQPQYGPPPVWSDGRNLIMLDNAVCPPRCVKCNAPAEFSWTKRLYWCSPWYFLFLPLGLLIVLIIILAVRRSARVTVYLCEEHRRGRVRAIAISWISVALLVGMIVGAVMILQQTRDKSVETTCVVVIIAALFASLVMLVVATSSTNPVSPRRIDGMTAALKGAGRDFLATLPGPGGNYAPVAGQGAPAPYAASI